MQKFRELSQNDRLAYEALAREIIYPDLRLGYKEHDKMLRVLSKAIYECAVLALEGGGGHNQGTDREHSIFDSI